MHIRSSYGKAKSDEKDSHHWSSLCYLTLNGGDHDDDGDVDGDDDNSDDDINASNDDNDHKSTSDITN